MDKTLLFGIWVVVALGALNWGTVELMDFNLLTDLLQLSSEMESAAKVLIGAAGAINLVQLGSEVMD